MECKVLQDVDGVHAVKGRNRYIVECKAFTVFFVKVKLSVEIDTLWNVKANSDF